MKFKKGRYTNTLLYIDLEISILTLTTVGIEMGWKSSKKQKKQGVCSSSGGNLLVEKKKKKALQKVAEHKQNFQNVFKSIQ